MASGKRGGYNCSFVVGLSEDLQSECSICLNVLREPYMVGCCGYRFCRTCIAPIQKKAQKCPLCKSSFTSLPDRQLERILNKKLVHCSNKAHNGCEREIPLGSLEEHLKTCRIQCSFCQSLCLFTQAELKQHYGECPRYQVPCPNGCGAKPPREDIWNHVDYTCTKHLVDCFFKFSGCNIQLTRNEMPQHTEENRSEHMAMTIKMVNELKEENAILKRKLEEKESGLKSRPSSPTSVSVSQPFLSIPPQDTTIIPTCRFKCLEVTNLPPGVCKSVLKNSFGQCGMVHPLSVYLDKDLDIGIIKYKDEQYYKAALERSEKYGINLKSSRLCVTPAYLF